MPRLLFTCSYLGHAFRGWQSQVCGKGAQDYMERAFARILGEEVGMGVTKRISASGRTDAGVHAKKQYFHLDIPESSKLGMNAWRNALNAHLPSSLRVHEVRPVPAEFHARFSAESKTYEYLMETGAVLSPFDAERIWHVQSRHFDKERLRDALACYEGEHDFRLLCAKRGNEPAPTPADYYRRAIYASTLETDGTLLKISFTGNGFLYRMVRLMVGTAHAAARGRFSTEQLTGMLSEPEKHEKARDCAPSCGLYLAEVHYGELGGASS